MRQYNTLVTFPTAVLSRWVPGLDTPWNSRHPLLQKVQGLIFYQNHSQIPTKAPKHQCSKPHGSDWKTILWSSDEKKNTLSPGPALQQSICSRECFQRWLHWCCCWSLLSSSLHHLLPPRDCHHVRHRLGCPCQLVCKDSDVWSVRIRTVIRQSGPGNSLPMLM